MNAPQRTDKIYKIEVWLKPVPEPGRNSALNGKNA